MQIADTSSNAVGGGGSNAGINARSAFNERAQPVADASSSAPSTSQDDAVQISPQGYAAASSDDDSDGAADTNGQPVQSLVYGALGLERPDAPADPNQAYTLGRWIAAGITLGGLVSLFI